MDLTNLPARSVALVDRVSRRFGWGIADQALSSLTNMALGVMVAREVTASGFGAFSLALAAYMVAIGLHRGLASEPLMVRYSSAVHADWVWAARASSGVALTIGTVAGMACLVASGFFEGSLRSVLLGLAVSMPGLILQDAWRFAFFAQGRGGQAFLVDLVWAVLLFSALIVLITIDRATVGWVVLAWGASASLAGIIGIAQARVLPDPRRTLEWWRRHKDLAGRYAGEFALVTGTRQFTVVLISVVAGLVAVGAIRGGALLLGPLNILFAGLTLTAVPVGARLVRRSVGALKMLSAKVSVAIVAISLLWGAVLLFLPDRFGVEVLGDTWTEADQVLVPLVLMTVLRAASLGPITGLRALAAAKRSLRTQSRQSVIRLVLPTGGAAVSGAEGAAWGFAIGAALETMMWWGELRGGISDHDGAAPADH